MMERPSRTVDRHVGDCGKLLDPSSWSKLQMYAGDVGRAHGWDGHHQFEQINALRHALASAYVTFIGGASAAMLAGDWHELHTSIDDIIKGKPWSGSSQDMKDWKDHGIDINNNRAGAKIAQEIKDKGKTLKKQLWTQSSIGLAEMAN